MAAHRRGDREPPVRLRAAIAARGRPLVGVFVLSASPVAAEMAGLAGLDFVIVDCEHAALSPFGERVSECIRAAQAGGAHAFVRVPPDLPPAIAAVLDCGADGVVVPHVTTAEAARAAVAAGHYPPLGTRGAAPVVRAGRYGVQGWRQAITSGASSGLVIPLIEDPAAVQAVQQICAVPGVEAVMFGAFDLSVALGRPTDGRDDAAVEGARQRVYAAAAAADVAVGDYAWDGDSARQMAAAGAQWITMGNDVGLLGAALRTAAGSLGDQGGGAGRPEMTSP